MTLQLARWCGATFGLKVAQNLEKLLFFTRSATHPGGALSGTHPRAGISEGKTNMKMKDCRDLTRRWSCVRSAAD